MDRAGVEVDVVTSRPPEWEESTVEADLRTVEGFGGLCDIGDETDADDTLDTADDALLIERVDRWRGR